MEKPQLPEGMQLRGCPCCGGAAELARSRTSYGRRGAFYVRCRDCGVRTAYAFVNWPKLGAGGPDESTRLTEAQAIMHSIMTWNRREPGC